MLDVFVTVILPIFVVVAVAAAVHWWRKIPVGPISQATLYLLTPALTFTAVVNQTIPAEISFAVIGATAVCSLLILGVAAVISKLLRHDRAMQSAFILSTAFPNGGNLALPILQLAFGTVGLNLGVTIFVTQMFFTQSLGIMVAARSQMSGFAPLLQVFKMPAFWGAAAGLVVKITGVAVPAVIWTPATMLGGAAIPVMLVVLGFQIGAGFRLERWGSLTAALFVRLLLSAPLAWGVASLAGLDGVPRAVMVIVFSMPVAVITTIMAQQFDANPKFVTSMVITSTAVSMVTLTLIITLLNSLLGL